MKQECKKCRQEFILDPDDLGFYKKMKVPNPKVCPDCRFKMRAVFRNERTLYKRVCDLCGSSIITMYNPDSPYTVYCNSCWMSDKWDPYSYAMDYNPKRAFFEQLKELTIKVPKSATYSSVSTGPNINSDYANFAGGNKDGYLIFNSGPGNENCAYSRGLIKSQDIFDTYYADKIENVYESVNIHNSSRVTYGQNVYDCINCHFIFNCSDCQNCFGCVNLHHKSYYFFNEPLEREEWFRRVAEISGSYIKMEETKKKFEEFSLKFPRRSNNNLKTTNCSGDYIFESKNCHNCFELSNCEDLRHCFSVKRSKDCSDMIGHCRGSELLYNGVGVGAGSRNIICSWWVEVSQDVAYAFATRQSKNCIGTDGIKNGNFVVLNKRYSQEEYEEVKNKITEELKSKDIFGDFFPPELAFFGYNETIGQDNMPLNKVEARAQGFQWQDNIQKTEGQETISPAEIPDNIKDIPDSILDQVLTCSECSRNYRLFGRELQFYRKMSIPIPRKCWSCRFSDRLRRRGPFKSHEGICAKCQKEITTNYAPDRPEIVYCVECYQQEVY